MDNVYAQIIEKIIAQQEAIIGPIAIQQAEMVDELKIDWSKHSVGISGSPQTAIDDLVQQYKDLFGQIAVETCKEAASKLLSQIPVNDQPKSLQ
jgi:hypothetical protein